MRFPEFSDEWEKTTLGNISNIKIYQPQTIKPLNFGKYKVFGANGYIGYYKEYNHNTNQVTISCRGEKSGIVNFVESFVWITGNSMVLNLDKTSEIIKKFLYYELIINNVNYLITGSGQPQLTRDNLVQHKIYFPNIDEQTKIADFLSLIDKRIELQNKIIRDYKLLKKGIQNYFFKNINSDNSYSLSCFLEEYTLKNLKNNLQVVSVGKYGIRQRNEIYSKVLSDDLSKNKVIFQDTLTIGMGTKQIDFGILSKNVEYCVSPAYRTYKIKNINSEYLKYYLEIINNQLSRKIYDN